MQGTTYLALSNDSTCTHQLYSHMSGYETLTLRSMTPQLPKPHNYTLPSWTQGDWGSVYIEGGQLTYTDSDQFTRYTAVAISSPRIDRYVVRIDTACGHTAYSCVAIEQRSDNIIELMLATQGKSPDPQLCDPSNFHDTQWVTLGSDRVPSSCPLVGQFSSSIPDDYGFVLLQ